MDRRCGSLAVVVLTATLAGCSAATWQGVAAGLAGASAGATAATAGKLMLFGGENHTTYLGCLNCSKYATDSLSLWRIRLPLLDAQSVQPVRDRPPGDC
jgi:hypothetical protein